MAEDRISDIVPEVLEKYTLKPLATKYNGIQYRSRLEARWAVFFDTLRLKHDYEPEGFDLGDGVLYLPDFWLPDIGCWLEVKRADPDEDACDKASRLAVASGKRVYVFFGGHEIPDQVGGAENAYAFFSDDSGDYGYSWCECNSCGRIGIEYQGRADRLPCKETWSQWNERAREGRPWGAFSSWENNSGGSPPRHGCPRLGNNGDRGHNANTHRLLQAFQNARGMRFTR